MSWLVATGRAILDLYRRGFWMFVVALPVLALIIIPEFAQHVVEIRLGMFDSIERARAVGNEPLRWAFGYVKIAGLVLTFLAAARFQWTRDHGGRWWNLGEVRWGWFLLWLVLFVGVPLPGSFLAQEVPNWATLTLSWVIMIATLPMLYLMLGAWFGDRTVTVKRAWTRSWLYMPLLVLLLVLAFLPANVLHQYNHHWAFGAPVAVVWLLMIFDSLVVGLLAGLTGTAMYLGYEAFARRERSG